MLIVFRKNVDLSKKLPFIVMIEPIHPHVGLSGLQSLLRKKKKKKSARPLRMRERTASFRIPKRVISRFRSGNVT